MNEWLNPPKKLHSPYLLDNIEIAVDRIIQAIKKGEKIGIFWDCDSDGCCSGAIMYRYLNNFTTNLEVVYCQRDSGHGLSSVIDKIPHDLDLLIVVDSSTNSIDECKSLKENSIDVVILDHHPMKQKNKYAILVNNQACKYPNKELSGAGIVYKTCQVLDDKLEENIADDYIDLVGLGVYGDVMSVLSEENRYLIYQSLKNINNPGLKTLLEISNVKKPDSSTYGFTIAPLINASARMNQIELVIQLLISDNKEECLELAKQCKKLNDTRKKEQIKIYKKMDKLKQIDTSQKIIIAITEESNKGFNGLIAAVIANKWSRPVLVVRNKDGLCEGSGRGYGKFDLKEFLKKSGLFEYLEGHSSALGVGFKLDNLNKIHEYINENLKDVVFSNDIIYDIEVNLDDINARLINDIQAFNFITSNKDFPPIKILIKDLPVLEWKIIGGNKDTIKITSENGFEALKFRASQDDFNKIDKVDKIIDAVGTLNIGEFYNWQQRRVIINNQIFIDDFKIK